MNRAKLSPAPRVAGIVLAGGRASRFGRDKLVEMVDGRPLLHHALEALAPVVGELLVVIAPTGQPPVLPRASLGRTELRVVRDPVPFGGPLVAVATALDATTAPTAILVGGDMPALRTAVLSAMLEALQQHGSDLVLLEGPGPVQSIPAVLRTAPARAAAGEAVRRGERALRALYDRLHGLTLPLGEWARLDPEMQTLRDVDTPADLPH